ncbi:MAG: MotA/TolQ/ExbB proton channel family protein [Hyphomicrobiaceae bacterium]|nr:MotA/TolQ/ExbB proton channel family protein [Hyphomicrobiaceae bacterium]
MNETVTPTLAGLRAAYQELYALGGPVVTVLLLLSVVALAASLIAGARLVPLWLTGEAREARPETRFGPLKRLWQARAQAAGAIEALAITEARRLTSGLRLLEIVAQAAPLLGLFGTVIGMIDAFRALEAAGGDADPSALAGGIWVALLTTAVGLAVAIPVQALAQGFSAIAEAETARIEALASRLIGQGEAGDAD